MKHLMAITACVLTTACASVPLPRMVPQHPSEANALALPEGFADRFRSEPTAASSGQRRSLRRELATRLIAESNRRCENYLTDISITRNTSRGLLDVLGLTFASVGSLASPNSANWWAGASTLSQSTRSSLEQTVFNGAEFATLYVAIGNGRRAWRDAFLVDLEAGKMDGWQGDSILAAIQDYDLLCGINYGLARVQQAVQAQAGQTTSGPP